MMEEKSPILSPGTPPAAPPPGGTRAWLPAVLGLLLAAVLGGLLWKSSREADQRFSALSTSLERLSGKQEELAQGLAQAVEQTAIARERAQAAESRAEELEAAKAESEQQASEAEAARAEAEREAETARRQAEEAAQALADLRKAREEELNRMHEALSKVAATQRTANGLVIDLTNDSFKFDFDKATLRQENRELLSRLAGILLASHGYRLYIYGHTDDIGSDDYNLSLSERRARAVGDYLVASGLPPDILLVKGMGKSSPRVQAATAEAREKNRRVEIGIVDTVITYQGEQRPGNRP